MGWGGPKFDPQSIPFGPQQPTTTERQALEGPEAWPPVPPMPAANAELSVGPGQDLLHHWCQWLYKALFKGLMKALCKGPFSRAL